MPANTDRQIQKLEARAQSIHANLLRFASRPFVIEFAGTPKAGKTTSVEAIRHFFTRHDFRVHVLVEQAPFCPIPMKGHLFFSTWCAAMTLAELLAGVETETDIIIVDRGIFDTLVWLTLQRERGELTAAEADTMEAFLLLDRWRSLVDLAVVMNVTADEAIARENSQRISRKPGGIMNPAVLQTIAAAVGKTVKAHRAKFADVIEHETSGHDVRSSNAALAKGILDRLESFLDPEILVVPTRQVEALRFEDGGAFSEQANAALLGVIKKFGKFMRRSEAERDARYVQIVACGLLMHDEQVFLFERQERDPKYALYGKSTVWQGAHVRRLAGKRGVALLESAVSRRIAGSLFLSRVFPTRLVGCCWNTDTAHSARHLGAVFAVDIDDDHTAADLRRKEFRHGRGYGLAGRFVSCASLAAHEPLPKLEGWSAAILKGFIARRDRRGAR